MRSTMLLIALVLIGALPDLVTANEGQDARIVVMVNGDSISSNHVLFQYMDGMDLPALKRLAAASWNQPVDYNDLISHLPTPMSGWIGLDPSGMLMNTGEGEFSFATREYHKDGADDEVKAVIWDTRNQEMGPWFVYWSGAHAWESTEGYMRSTTYKGYEAWESRDYGDQSGVLTVGLKSYDGSPDGEDLLVAVVAISQYAGYTVDDMDSLEVGYRLFTEANVSELFHTIDDYSAIIVGQFAATDTDDQESSAEIRDAFLSNSVVLEEYVQLGGGLWVSGQWDYAWLPATLGVTRVGKTTGGHIDHWYPTTDLTTKPNNLVTYTAEADVLYHGLYQTHFEDWEDKEVGTVIGEYRSITRDDWWAYYPDFTIMIARSHGEGRVVLSTACWDTYSGHLETLDKPFYTNRLVINNILEWICQRTVRTEILDSGNLTIPYVVYTILHDPSGDRSKSWVKQSEYSNISFGFDFASTHKSDISIEIGTTLGGFKIWEDVVEQETRMETVVVSLSQMQMKESVDVDDEEEQNREYIGPGFGDRYIGEQWEVSYAWVNRTYSVGNREVLTKKAFVYNVTGSNEFSYNTWYIKQNIEEEWRDKLLSLNIGSDNTVDDAESDLVTELHMDFDWTGPGVSDNYEATTSVSRKQAYSFNITVSEGTALWFDLETIGLPVGGGATVSLDLYMGHWWSAERRTDKTIGYVLGDDNADSFVTDIYIDEVYGTLLFITDEENSYSSAPHESWTKPRAAHENSPPRIDYRTPRDDPVVLEGSQTSFSIHGIDPEVDPLEYRWFLDGKEVSQGQTYLFSAPLGSGDSSVELVARVSDLSLSNDTMWTITITAHNEPPNIVSCSPFIPRIEVEAGEDVRFSADVIDEERDPMQWTWSLDGQPRSYSEEEYTLRTEPGMAGLHRLVLNIYDGTDHAVHEWEVLITVPELFSRICFLSILLLAWRRRGPLRS